MKTVVFLVAMLAASAASAEPINIDAVLGTGNIVVIGSADSLDLTPTRSEWGGLHVDGGIYTPISTEYAVGIDLTAVIGDESAAALTAGYAWQFDQQMQIRAGIGAGKAQGSFGRGVGLQGRFSMDHQIGGTTAIRASLVAGESFTAAGLGLKFDF